MALAQFATNFMSGTLSYYPVEDGEDGVSVRTSVALPEQTHDRIQYIADLWNAMDAAKRRATKGRRKGEVRRKKWKAASVMARLIEVGVGNFATQVGGIPDDPKERAERIAKASVIVAKLAAEQQK